jgi:hypothetical protein
MLPENAPLNSYRIPDGTEVIAKPADRQPITAAA